MTPIAHAVRFALGLSVLVCALPLMVLAAIPPPDKVAASGGDITIQPINHATLQIVHAGHVIDVDPVPQADFTGLPAPTLILITDIHGDHMDPATIAKLRQASTRVVAPQAVVDAAKLEGAIVLANGETKNVDGISIEAVPMYNTTPARQQYHTKGRGNGYVLTIGGKRLYIAGDTEGTPEMRALENIDVAFIPMNLPYTMTAAEAAEAVKAFSPKIVYPYHYKGTDLTVFSAALKGTPIDVRIRDWYMK